MTGLTPAQPTTLPLKCPRCESGVVDWCCWELADLKQRVARGETMRQLLAIFPGKTDDAIRSICRRYGLGRPRPGIRIRRVRCMSCRTPFAPTSIGQKACDSCDPPATTVPAPQRAETARAA